MQNNYAATCSIVEFYVEEAAGKSDVSSWNLTESLLYDSLEITFNTLI